MFLRQPIFSLPSSVSAMCAATTARCVHADAVRAFDTEHLAAGSTAPAVDPDRVTLYNMRFCMYAHRTVLALLAKEIP